METGLQPLVFSCVIRYSQILNNQLAPNYFSIQSMKQFLFLLSILTLGYASVTTAQNTRTYTIRGIVMEQPSGEFMQRMQGGMNQGAMNRGAGRDSLRRPNFLPGTNVVLFTTADTLNQFRGATAGPDGRFEITRVPSGDYILKASFVGYHTRTLPVKVENGDLDRVMIFMQEDALTLDEVRISGLRPEVEVRGDTTVYNADGIRVNPDATAEELVRRLPGITIEDGQVQAQGQQVNRVLLDGQEFFGDDALLTLRNLPAEIVGQVELFDEMSDQARFTGFRDGNENRVLNIRTRPGMNVGQFGRANAAMGTDERYMGSGNFNYFNGPRRLSILGMSNNINQQNFSGEDLAGVNQASQQGGGRGGLMMGGGGFGGGMWGGGGAARNFLVGSQSGTNTIHSFGLNYIDRFEKTNINSSYFFNATNNSNIQSTERQYLTEANSDQLYNENTASSSENFNHRFNARIEHTFNNTTSFIWTPRVNARMNDRTSSDNNQTRLVTNELLNRSIGLSSNNTFNYNLNSNLLLRHRFEKRGRTMSANIRTDFDRTDGDQYQNTETLFYADEIIRRLTDQNTDISTGGYNLGIDIQYTEPIGERSQLQFGYNPSVTQDLSERDAFQLDPVTLQYTILDPNLTSRYENITTSHRISSAYRFNNQRFGGNVNLAFEHSSLDGEQTYPVVAQTNRSYSYLLPSGNIRYTIGQGKNVNLNYRASTRMPSASQLQDVVDNTNPTQLRGGNPDLQPQFTHNVSGRLQLANTEKAQFNFLMINVNYITDYIGNNTIIAQNTTEIRPGIVLGRGSRFTSPENLGDSWNIRSFVNHTRPFTLIKSNLSINGGVTYTLQPTSDNNIVTDARTVGLNAGTSLNSNISPNVDFSVSYRANYSIVENANNLGINSNYYTGRAFARVNLLPKGKWLIASDLNLTHYSGLGEDFESQIIYWNASFGYKFLPNNAAEIRITVVDILGQNNNVNRIINEGYVEDVRSNVLTRYALINFSYNFRNFRSRS